MVTGRLSILGDGRLGDETISAILSRVVEISPDPVLIIDPDGVILFTNAATEGLLGYSENELIGKPLEILLPERFRDEHVEQRERYADAPHARPMGRGLAPVARRKDGTEVPVDIALAPLASDGLLMTAAVVRDLTELKAIERIKDKIVEIVHHELRTPLTVILGMNETLVERGAELDVAVRQQMYDSISNRTNDLMAIASKLFAEIDRILHREHPAPDLTITEEPPAIDLT